MSEINLTDANFDAEVMKSTIPVLVDFYADWCMPCKMVAPVIAQIAKDYEGKLKVCKVNIDNNPAIADRFGIVSIPTLAVFKNGALEVQKPGAQPRPGIEALFKHLL